MSGWEIFWLVFMALWIVAAVLGIWANAAGRDIRDWMDMQEEE